MPTPSQTITLRITTAAALALLLTACAGGGQRLGQPPPSGGATVAEGRFGLWQRWGRNELPKDSTAANRALVDGTLAGISQPCTVTHGHPVALPQQALFDHLASQLWAGLDIPLTELAVGPVSDPGDHCRYVVLYSGRQGGRRPGWILLGVVRVEDGQLVAAASEGVPHDASADDLHNLVRRLSRWLLP